MTLLAAGFLVSWLGAQVLVAQGASPVAPSSNGPWNAVAAEAAGFDAEALEGVLDYARSQRSSSIAIVVDGRLVAQRHWPVEDREESRYRRMVVGQTADGRPIEDVASVQKSVISFLIGVAEGRGLVDIDRPISSYLGEGWSKAPRAEESKITVRHVLSMTSGLRPNRAFEASAGERWRYNTNVYSRLVKALETATEQSIQELTREWLTEPLGMSDSRWEPRPWVSGGQDANSIGFATTALDLARFGLLVLREGRWGGDDLLGNATWLERSLGPSQALNPSYGYLWWLNGQSGVRRGAGERLIDGPLISTAPADLVAAQGALGRMCYVVPSLDLVVTRLGDQPGRGFGEELWRLLMAARTPDN